MTRQNRFPEAIVAAVGTKAAIESLTTYPLAVGEIAYATDTNQLYVGSNPLISGSFLPIPSLTYTNTFTNVTTTRGHRSSFVVLSGNYSISILDEVIIFTGTANANLPPASGTGQTYRIVNESVSGVVTVDGNGSETIKGNITQVLYPGEDIIITDYASGKWA